MARARNVKPGLCENEDLAECSIPARYLFVCMPMYADREGRLEDRPRKLKKYIFGGDTIDIEPLLQELASHGTPRFIVRYQNLAGRFIQITGFAKHQSPHYSEKVSVINPPDFSESTIDDGGNSPGEGSSSSEGNSGRTPENSGKSPPIKRGSQPPDSLIPDFLIPEVKTLSGKPDCLNGKSHADAEEVLDLLNQKTGHHYKPVKANLELIEARVKEGFTIDELRAVVNRMCAKWGNDVKMSDFLRPATLFNRTNFAQYAGALDGGNDWMKDVQ